MNTPIKILNINKNIVNIVPQYKRKTKGSSFLTKGDLVVFLHEKFITFTTYMETPKLIEGGVYEIEAALQGVYKLKGEDCWYSSSFFAIEDFNFMGKYIPNYIYDFRFFYCKNSSKFLKTT